MRLAANLSLLFTEVPLLERFAAAADAEFDAVEIQFPYEAAIGDLVRAREAAGVELVLINIPAGDLAAGDVGLTGVPGRQEEYRTAVSLCLDYADALGVKKINSLSGRPPPDRCADAMPTLVENLRFAADRFAAIGATVLVEPVNPTDVPNFLFNRLAPAMDAVNAVGRDNVRLLFDLYHMAQTEPSLPDAVRQAAGMTDHVQFADTPGRHEPGTGTVDFEPALRALKETGYGGIVSAEYRPTGATVDSLGWRDRFQQWMA
jgi:hydroxypyruvate isomerase